jgi:hypothetical protein
VINRQRDQGDAMFGEEAQLAVEFILCAP